MEAPTKELTAGKATTASADGPGAGASVRAAAAPLIEAAAVMRAAYAIFFMSMVLASC